MQGVDYVYENGAEFTEYSYIPAKFSNELYETTEAILKNFKIEEENYMEVLASLVQAGKSIELKKYYLDPYELLGRIDLIERFHRHQFLPDLLSTNDVSEIVEIFFQHKSLFYLYEDFMRREPLLTWLKVDFKKLEMFYKDKKSILTAKLEYYVLVLCQLKNVSKLNPVPVRFDVAIKMIVDIVTKGHCNAKRDFTSAEMIYTEMRYIRALETSLRSFEENVFKNSHRYMSISEKLYGMLPEIYKEQKKFMLSLQPHLYDFDIIGIMKCFLKHNKCFKLYVDDRRLKRPQVLEDCRKQFPAIGIMPDRTLDRLFKYPLFLDRFKSLYRSHAIAYNKILEVENLFNEVKDGANNIIAIINIIESNVRILEQGRFWWRGAAVVSTNSKAMADHNKKECVVFLFEKCFIFTKTSPRNKYLYLYHILTHDMTYNFCKKDNENELNISRGQMRQENFRLTIKENGTLLKLENAICDIMNRTLVNISTNYRRRKESAAIHSENYSP